MCENDPKNGRKLILFVISGLPLGVFDLKLSDKGELYMVHVQF